MQKYFNAGNKGRGWGGRFIKLNDPTFSLNCPYIHMYSLVLVRTYNTRKYEIVV